LSKPAAARRARRNAVLNGRRFALLKKAQHWLLAPRFGAWAELKRAARPRPRSYAS
jgi:hypothetical protein